MMGDSEYGEMDTELRTSYLRFPIVPRSDVGIPYLSPAWSLALYALCIFITSAARV